MDSVAILERAVALPSWRSPDNPDVESDAAAYFTEVIQQELPWLHIDHQHVAGNRFNIFARDEAPLQILFAGHLDTVPPGTGWERRISGERVDNRFYGRGAFDTKGGIVALLSALAGGKPTRGVGVLLYCDEEYDFHGMRIFLAETRDRIRPSLVIALEPTDLRIRNGCRGVAEFHPIVRGKTGHAARPWTGTNALAVFIGGMRALDAFADKHKHKEYGRMTYNVAALHCGQSRGLTNSAGKQQLGEDGNVIPDYAEGVIEIRTLPKMDLDDCIETFRRGVEEAGGRLEAATKRFDFRGFHTERKQLAPLVDVVAAVLGREPEFEEIDKVGYSDVQLMARRFEMPCAIIGPSGGNLHSVDEYVELDSMRTLQQILERFLESYRTTTAAA